MALRHSRNARRAWHLLDETTPVARPGRAASHLAQDAATRRANVHDEGLHAQSDAFRVACRLFPGFAALPASFRASLDGYAPLLRPETGPLSLHEREVIARAVAGRDGEVFGADADGAAAGAPQAGTAVGERERHVAEFAVKVTRRWLAIEGGDVERLLDRGVTVREIRAIAEVAAVFHFLAEVSAAMLLRPRPSRPGRAPMTVVGGHDASWRALGRWLA